jgi:hypothetical protein
VSQVQWAAASESARYSALHDPVDLVPSQVHALGYRRDAGLVQPCDHVSLEDGCERGVRLGPGDRDLVRAVLFAGHTRDPDLDDGAVLAGRQVTPAPCPMVVTGALGATGRALELRRGGRIDQDDDLAAGYGGLDLGHAPRGLDAEDRGVQGGVSHARERSRHGVKPPLPTRDPEAPVSLELQFRVSGKHEGSQGGAEFLA